MDVLHVMPGVCSHACVLLLLCLNLVLVVVVAYIKWNGREYVLVVFNLVVILKGI